MQKQKSIVILTSLAILVCFLQACTGCTQGPAFTMAGSSTETKRGGGDGQPLEGKPEPGLYYRIVPGFECAGQPKIPGYIEVSSSSVKLHAIDSATCQDTVTLLNASALESSPLTPDHCMTLALWDFIWPVAKSNSTTTSSPAA